MSQGKRQNENYKERQINRQTDAKCCCFKATFMWEKQFPKVMK